MPFLVLWEKKALQKVHQIFLKMTCSKTKQKKSWVTENSRVVKIFVVFFFDENIVFFRNSEYGRRTSIGRPIFLKRPYDTKFPTHHHFRLQISEKHVFFFHMIITERGRTAFPSRNFDILLCYNFWIKI